MPGSKNPLQVVEMPSAWPAMCLTRLAVEIAAQTVLSKFSRVDILINGAGGNKPAATTNPDQRFFDLPCRRPALGF